MYRGRGFLNRHIGFGIMCFKIFLLEPVLHLHTRTVKLNVETRQRHPCGPLHLPSRSAKHWYFLILSWLSITTVYPWNSVLNSIRNSIKNIKLQRTYTYTLHLMALLCALKMSRCVYMSIHSDWSFSPSKRPRVYVWHKSQLPPWQNIKFSARLKDNGLFSICTADGKANTVNLLWEFTSTYKQSNDILNSLYEWVFFISF